MMTGRIWICVCGWAICLYIYLWVAGRIGATGLRGLASWRRDAMRCDASRINAELLQSLSFSKSIRSTCAITSGRGLVVRDWAIPEGYPAPPRLKTIATHSAFQAHCFNFTSQTPRKIAPSSFAFIIDRLQEDIKAYIIIQSQYFICIVWLH
ncbi:hypothetical protein KQX54_019209 [Cotesia glomerata]|uniref:Secreted protein n=1 Tax=Cotesia glomerata TaxID=32391 RepID=A0AAV7IFH9_COTGL|nr:hypothetical protein KQX54_019209 [Cotesia glomerata]